MLASLGSLCDEIGELIDPQWVRCYFPGTCLSFSVLKTSHIVHAYMCVKYLLLELYFT